MRKEILRLFLMSAAISVCLLLGTGIVRAQQCGLPGLPPCPSKTTPKRTTPKPTVTKPKTPIKMAAKTPTKQTCPPPTNNNDAPSNFTQTINGVKFEMVGIPSGSFCMGANNGNGEEKPVHRVDINYIFYIGKYEVTQAQWKAVMGNNPSTNTKCGINCPVEMVSWDDAKRLIQKLNALQDDYEYRLPTEAEWEYACRAGTTGDSYGKPDLIAWYQKNNGNTTTHPVGQKQPNAFGLYDTLGNVWEWCEDVNNYNGEIHIAKDGYVGLPTDGSANLTIGDPKWRVLRGGSWLDEVWVIRSASRYRYTHDGKSYNFYNGDFGIRLVAIPK